MADSLITVGRRRLCPILMTTMVLELSPMAPESARVRSYKLRGRGS